MSNKIDMKTYIVFNKKRIYAQGAEIDFTGIMNIIGVFTSMGAAQGCVAEEYKKSKNDFYSTQEAFAKGTVKWDDQNLQMTQVEGDKTTTLTWLIKEVEVEDCYDPCPFMSGPDKVIYK